MQFNINGNKTNGSNHSFRIVSAVDICSKSGIISIDSVGSYKILDIEGLDFVEENNNSTFKFYKNISESGIKKLSLRGEFLREMTLLN